MAQWNIHPTRTINTIELISHTQRHVEIPLDPPAGSMPRSELERQLLARLEKAGIAVRTKTSVAAIYPSKREKDDHLIELVSGELVPCRHLILSSGRFSGQKRTVLPYRGVTGRFKGIHLDDRLKMFLLDGGYVGLSPNDLDGGNLSMLTKDPRAIPPFLLEQLTHADLLSPGWLKVQGPPFGKLPWPNWPNCYPIGDAAGLIPPITGQGLTMGILSGWLAADYLNKDDPQGYRKAWNKKFSARLRLGLLLHHIVQRPLLTTFLLRLFPGLPQKAYHWTRCTTTSFQV